MESANPSFGQLVVRAAWKNTWGLLRNRTRDIFYAVPSMVVGALIFYGLYGMPAVKEQGIILAAFVFAPGGIFLLLVFLWNLFIASDQLVYEAIKGIQINVPVTTTVVAAPPPSMPINWAIWKARAKYTVNEFSAILAQTEPSSAIYPPDRAAYNRLIREEAEAKKLKYIPQYSIDYAGSKRLRPVAGDTEITRGDALAWAESKNFPVDHIK